MGRLETDQFLRLEALHNPGEDNSLGPLPLRAAAAATLCSIIAFRRKEGGRGEDRVKGWMFSKQRFKKDNWGHTRFKIITGKEVKNKIRRTLF